MTYGTDYLPTTPHTPLTDQASGSAPATGRRTDDLPYLSSVRYQAATRDGSHRYSGTIFTGLTVNTWSRDDGVVCAERYNHTIPLLDCARVPKAPGVGWDLLSTRRCQGH